MEFSQLAQARRSVRVYAPDATITDAELEMIFAEVILSPSSFNMQHWQFVVVREVERKQALRKLSYGQAQVEQCAAVVLVCGRLDAHLDAERIYAGDGAAARDKYVPMIKGVYQEQPQLQREEAIRSGALAAMSLMYAARNRGWDSGPMIGFDAAKVADFLELPATSVPVMMVTLGHADAAGLPPRGYRRPVSEVVRLETMRGRALGD